jgi:hypothetical protein
MALGEVARCFLCKVLASGEELELNRQTWEYECRDKEACAKRQANGIDRKPRRNAQ